MWFTQEASVGLKSIDKWGNPHFYTQDAGLNEELTIVRTGNQGIYAGSNDASSYLYYMSYGDSVFRNISRQVDFSYSGDLRIEDIAEDGDTIWLATSIGVLRQTKTEVTKVYFEQKFDNLLVKTIKKQANSPYVWFSNAYGLIQYNLVSGEYNVYDESHGLPSNTINTRGLIVNDDGIWVGTASGLAFSDYNFLNLEKTPKPSVVQFIVDNKTIKTTKFPYHELPSNPYIEIVISSPSYPSNKLRYQYKLENGAKPAEWTDVPDGNLLALSKLHSGKHALAFRAKKLGNYDWSEPVFFRFHIKTSLYETWYFKSTILLLAIFLILMTRYITSVFLKKRQVELEKLVNERTVELASANENLLMRNQELDQFVYSTSHDLSAPLKSIRGLINIANYETSADEQKSLLKRMNESVVKLEKFIKDVISYSRNARLEIKKETILLNDMVQEVLEHISNLDNFHKIKFTIDIPPNTAFVGDETRIRIILNNLISNAVKFQRTDESHLPEVYIAYRWRANKHTIVVRDNGQGIPNEFLDKIFHMFYRANYTSDGSGLGLYILKETVQKLDGEVKVESREGSGSEFSVSFP
ncbi:MAG: HAMP domain-containing histidine kinase [Cyclobacteriaceae bacterium]|nr:HAMP domain-containing histidine kinase [Cyclobacteriaceae bacterium]